MLCDLVFKKNNKLGILQIFEKMFTQKSYLVQSFMAFKPYELVIATTMA
jgi:hypothetical protein